MTHEIIRLTDKYDDTYLESYIHSHDKALKIAKRKAIIVCPGGGYSNLSEREAEPIALKYFAASLNVFVLRYSVGKKAADFAPIIEACLAIRYIREHCDEFGIDPEHIFITGFSAGGHLAAAAGTMWYIPEVQAHMDGADPEICRPNATVLCYPVITNKPCRHKGSMLVLNGYVDDEAGMERFSVENYVNENTAPAFLWHTANDSVVPVQNSLVYAAKLSEYKIPFELHVYPTGVHGLALSNKETYVNWPSYDIPYNAAWIDLAIHWVRECPFKKTK
jgi:acetyl esterase/lipase